MAAGAVGRTGAADASARVPAPVGCGAASVVLIGIERADAKRSPADAADVLRSAAGSALRALSGVHSVAVLLPIDDTADAEAVSIGALLGAYQDTRHKSEAPSRGPVEWIALCVQDAVDVDSVGCATISRTVAAARDLVNEPPLDLYLETFAETVVREAEADDLRGLAIVMVIDDDELRERGFGGLIGVGSGSTRGPRLVRVDYAPEWAERHLAFVGKGIIFDSGGISLKPPAKMEKMKSDMAGAAAAVEALFGIARLGLPVRVTAWLALAENMPSGSVVRPADVLRIYGGTTVEVTNTDAEGRLVLADSLVAAQGEDPDLIVDIATLTGAPGRGPGAPDLGCDGHTSTSPAPPSTRTPHTASPFSVAQVCRCAP
ncbi:leucyl aminopeptidase family protein [Brevibacterium sp. FAM 27836]|uniref:leucyl aminopeptidase family protein n=1 Tax=Brevibacterium sp. FAM 27836 TaxID=3446693 RepID=UPI003F512D7F